MTELSTSSPKSPKTALHVTAEPPQPTPMPPPRIPKRSSSTARRDVTGARAEEPTFQLPKLRLECRDLNHPGTLEFLSSVNAATAVSTAVQNVLKLLYISPSSQTTKVPSTRSVTLVLRSMDGVAYTTGIDLDDDHKEIHFSLDYIKGVSKERKTEELLGVITHELVHCYQYNAQGTCPGGLIEGIADWVRLKADLAPPHWKKHTDGKWDSGYERTGYFLEYMEKRYGVGTISRLNEKLRTTKYEEKRFWTELVGRPVEQLWDDYKQSSEEEELVMSEKEQSIHPSIATFGKIKPKPAEPEQNSWLE